MTLTGHMGSPAGSHPGPIPAVTRGNTRHLRLIFTRPDAPITVPIVGVSGVLLYAHVAAARRAYTSMPVGQG